MDGINTLNTPQPLAVGADAQGRPVTVVLRGRRHAVGAIIDRWLVEEGWWRGEATRRRYFRIELRSGRELVVYCDLATGQWWSQRD